MLIDRVSKIHLFNKRGELSNTIHYQLMEIFLESVLIFPEANKCTNKNKILSNSSIQNNTPLDSLRDCMSENSLWGFHHSKRSNTRIPNILGSPRYLIKQLPNRVSQYAFYIFLDMSEPWTNYRPNLLKL